MQTSKKPKTVGNFRIRRCVVRLQRMKTQPIKTRSAASKGPAPLRKRSVTSAIISTPSSSMKAKERLKAPIMQRNTKIVQLKKPPTPVVEELPPTIAAGRSRRVHKPNPKYASEYMVTPKILKSNRKDNESEGKPRRTSLSSLEDFFNEDSSEEEQIEDSEDSGDFKKYKTSKRIASDSDFADTIDESDEGSVEQKRKPGRPKKLELSSRRLAALNSSSNVLNKSAPATKNMPIAKNTLNTKTPPTQLQQLRRTFGANTVSPLSMGRKRKIDESGRESLPLAPKRFLLSTGPSKSKDVSNVVTRRNSPSLQISGSKISTPAPQIQKRETTSNLTQEKKTLPTKSALNVFNTKTPPTAKLHQSQQKPTSTTSARATANIRASAQKPIPSNKQNSTSSFPISRPPLPLPKPKAAENVKERVNKKVNETQKEATIDDFETMPTFTIVNIHDIINKKGDVLISKTPVKKSVPTTDRNKVLSVKSSSERSKSTQFHTSTPLVRKPPERNINNNATNNNKNMGKNMTVSSTSSSATVGGSTAEKKPAPRILNSVVGRKTKPVKPMIANLDISTDSPSCSLSLYDDDEDEDIDNDSKLDGSSSNETEPLEETKNIQSKLYSGVGASKSKSIEPKIAAKENSLAATNIQQQGKGSDSRKLSPEKVIVSRQGDKIIKKITCFETWYVINIPADTPEEYERNNLSMSLVQLANATKTIKLPSEMWTTKVTLYELSPSTLAKSNVLPYTGDLTEQNIPEEDRYKYQPSCVMFRRTVTDRSKSQLPYDRAVIFKNKTFFTNIEGKNVKLVGAPSTITQISEIETLLHIVDSLTLQSSLVEPAATVS